MTGAQIKYILNENGYDENEDLDLAKFSVIFLDQDSNLFPDKKRTRYHFDFDNEVLEIYDGKTKGNQFYYNKADRANHYVSFNVIAGFIQTSKMTDKGQILYRM